jgi:hypothetical protein
MLYVSANEKAVSLSLNLHRYIEGQQVVLAFFPAAFSGVGLLLSLTPGGVRLV